MYGAILGDMIGAPYEFDRGKKTKEFPLFSRGSVFTDDTVMTIAVAKALVDTLGKTDEEIRCALVREMQDWGHKYPDAGYGGRFYGWLHSKNPEPYNSFGNGSAMRVSAAGWLYHSLEETRHMARLTAEVTHNHPEGIKGAEAAASAIFMARCGRSKEKIRAYITDAFGYDLSRTCDEIRPGYHHVESCQETVPEAITAFLEGNDFEDVIRTAVSLGGDCDTLTCIAGSIAEAFYGVPAEMKEACRKRLPEEMRKVLDVFEEHRKIRGDLLFHDEFLNGNERIEAAIENYHADSSDKNLGGVLEAIRQRMHADGHFIFPVFTDGEDENSFSFRTVTTNDGKVWYAAFTSQEEFCKGAKSRILSYFIDKAMEYCLDFEGEGFIINPWGTNFLLSKDLIKMIFNADGDAEYAVPDVPITAELLEDGSFLKRVIGICNRNNTKLNMIRLLKILRDSWVWVPCTAVMSDADNARMEQMIREAEANGGPDSMTGKTFVSHDETRLVPDILQKDDEFFFPVFTTAEEMGEYGERFSKIQRHFLEAVNLARNNERNVTGIVINAFSDPIVIPVDIFEIIAGMDSSVEGVPIV